VDSHAHLNLGAFESDRAEVIARAQESGVGIIVNVGMDIESSGISLQLAEKYPQLFAAVGFHPHRADKLTEGSFAKLERLCRHKKVVAIGEIGLDFYRNLSPRKAQVDAFSRQLQLAREHNLPVIIHCRNAEEETLSMLTDWAQGQSGQEVLGVMHCFSGDGALAQKYLELGFLLSIAGTVTRPSSQTVAVARSLPLEGLMVETDSPFLIPSPKHGRNEPAFLSLIVNKIAESKGLAPETIAQATTQNAIRLFRLGKESIAGYL
jgi:TatD DNase family protein